MAFLHWALWLFFFENEKHNAENDLPNSKKQNRFRKMTFMAHFLTPQPLEILSFVK